jgi:vacuolar-type H+-ATPase subunit I/STV1
MDIAEIRSNLEGTQAILLRCPTKEFGSYKNAPDDHPALQALSKIDCALIELPPEDEDEEDEEELEEDLEDVEEEVEEVEEELAA